MDMKKFIEKNSEQIIGSLSCADRLLFKGYLPFYNGESMQNFLSARGILFKDLKAFLIKQSNQIKEHAQEMARKMGRPFEYLNGGDLRKDDAARKIAEQDGIREGLVCIFSRVEPARTFQIRYGKGRPVIVSHWGKCLCLYFYFIDPQFGLIHVRLQTWFGLDIQIYVNGHEWLARQMNQRAIRFKQDDNAFLEISEWQKAQNIADQLPELNWKGFLERYAKLVNPLLGEDALLGSMSYYWVTAQAEFSTDIVFKDLSNFQSFYERLASQAALSLSAQDIMMFLGRKLTGHFQGEVSCRLEGMRSTRLPGIRIRHQMKQNRIKMYNKSGVILRVETVINNPREFKLRCKKKGTLGESKITWAPLNKGVSGLWRYQEVAIKANQRYLNKLAEIDDPHIGLKVLDALTQRKQTQCGRTVKPFNPLSKTDLQLFESIHRGEHTINGFKNADIKKNLEGTSWVDLKKNHKQQSGTISRALGRLRAHGLIAKIPRSRRWKVTDSGSKVIAICIQIRKNHFPDYYNSSLQQNH